MLSVIYGAVTELRNWLYDRQIFRSKELPCKVISVGNIVAGGTGKTPIVIWLAQKLQSENIKIAIVLRGYKRKKISENLIVSDGKEILVPLDRSGDEAQMIARKLPEVPVVVSRSRYGGGLLAIENFNSELIILDDGFQHRKLKKDLELVAIDCTAPFGKEKLLPSGRLREPISALQRADVVLLTRTDQSENVKQIRQSIGEISNKLPIFETSHEPTKLYQSDTKQEFEFKFLENKKILAVCGIGNPMAFKNTIEKFHPEQIELMAFPDHHFYTEKDKKLIKHKFKKISADLILTTEKDLSKLMDLTPFVLSIAIKIADDHDLLVKLFEEM